MAEDVSVDEVVESYRSSLEELTFNSKPLINMLTMLAEDHVQFASEIVKIIEEQIKKVPVKMKLPFMYLIDSIIKNLSGTEYRQLFSQCIVQIFCEVFEEVDEKTRQALFKLRATWVDILPNKQLYILDMKVKLLDPAWPITANPPEHGVIHVNPKFLKPNTEKDRSPQFSPAQSDSSYTDDVKDEKDIETMRLKQELAETKAKLQRQLNEQALLRSKKLPDREPPAMIKLPPVGSSSILTAQTSNRDPRLNKGPTVNRDPRLKKQMVKEEQERFDIKKQMPKMENQLPEKFEIDDSSRTSDTSDNNSSRMDLASLITTFSAAAAKVVEEQTKKKSPQPSLRPKHSELAKKNISSKSEAVKEHSKAVVNKSIPNSKAATTVKKNSPAVSPSNSLTMKNTKRSEAKDKKHSVVESKKESPSKIMEQLDSKDKNNKIDDNKDSKDKNRTESKDKRDSKDRTESKEKDTKELDRNRDKSEKRSDPESNRHSPRRNNGRRSPDGRRNLRADRLSRDKQRESSRSSEPVIHSTDGKTDQFGRMLRKSEPEVKDSSPLKSDSDITSSKLENLDDTSLQHKIAAGKESAKEESTKMEVDIVLIEDSVNVNKADQKGNVPEEMKYDDITVQNMDIEEEEPADDNIANVDLNQDVDMRIQQAVPEIKNFVTNDVCESKDSLEEKIEKSMDEENTSSRNMKRPHSEAEIKPEVRPYKIPKLDSAKKNGSKSDQNSQEEISKLFGEEDVDYRHQMLPKAVLIPPPMPAENLLSPASDLRSPAQRRWSQFKESHPENFAQDIERKRLREAQMQSLALDNQDVDLRHWTSNRQRNVPLASLDSSLPIPKDLTAETQEKILQKAEQELKEGRISHGDHQEIVRQLGQVYDIQKKRQGPEEHSSRNLDLRDPRLRGLRESVSGYSEEVDRRVSYREDLSIDMHAKSFPSSHSLTSNRSDEPAGDSPRYRDRRENYNQRFDNNSRDEYEVRPPPRHGSRYNRRGGVDFNRRRNPIDYDGRSPRDFDMENIHSPNDFDDHSSPRFRDFDGRAHINSGDRTHNYDRDVDNDEHQGNYRPYGDYNRSNMRGPPMSKRDQRHDDLRDRRRTTPPQEGQYRDFSETPRLYSNVEDNQGPRPYGVSDRPSGPRPFGIPRHMLPQDGRGPHPNFPSMRPQAPRPKGQDGPRSASGNQSSTLSDPMDDPRWSAMRGLLDNEGTEELVIDGKPFELRMGTSRKLRIYGKVMDVAVDLKERGIRIDGQLIYNFGEPIKEVPAAGRSVRLYYHGLPKPIWLDGQQHEMRLDAPPRNVIVDGIRRGFQIDGKDMMILVDRLEKGPYGGPPRKIRIAGVDHDIAFQAPPRLILIDNKSCELKLDSKIPYIIMNGKPHGIRFDGEPRTVFINEQPFTIPVDRAEKIRIGPRPIYIAFGGPAHEIIIDGKWFEVKFDNVPKDIHFGNRHYTIRLPGPLPRVKILDELPPNFDDSMLMSSNQMLIPQPVQPVISAAEHLGEPVAPTHIEPFMTNPVSMITPVGPSDATSEALPPTNQASEGIMRPVGPFGPDVRFAQPTIPNIVTPNQQVLAPTGQPPLISQQNSIIQSQMPNALLGLRQNLMGFGLNQPNMPRPQPVNLIAQGIFNQVASSMINSQFNAIPGLSDFASGLRALSQITTGHVQSTLPPPIPQVTPQLQAQPIINDAAMVTGIQGNAFGGIQFGKQVVPASSVMPQTGMTGVANPSVVEPSMTATSEQIAANTSTHAAPVKPPIDINSLLNNLLKVGLIKDTAKTDTVTSAIEKLETSASSSGKKSSAEKQKDAIPDLTDFEMEKLRKPYAAVIEELHKGMQCHTCAARFTLNDHEKYRAHLDWHFRQNKMEQEMVKVAKNRKWFYTTTDWIQYEELEDTEEKSRSEIFEQMRSADEKPSGLIPSFSLQALEGKNVIKNPVATGIEGEDVCATCGDPFDQMWNEDTEEWILKNTIKVDGKTYHPVCYEDAQDTTYTVDTQPADSDGTVRMDSSELDSIIKTEPYSVDNIVKIEPDSIMDPVGVDSSGNIKPSDSESTVRLDSSDVNDISEAKSLKLESTIVKEVITVSHDEPLSPWAMDSNPTPELSRTPTPEPNLSFTPAPSISSESAISLIPQAEVSSEDPIPPVQDAILSADPIPLSVQDPILPVQLQKSIETIMENAQPVVSNTVAKKSIIDDRGL